LCEELRNYMGAVSQTLTSTHSRIKCGALGAVVSQTRFPTLAVLDAISVDADPNESGSDCGTPTAYEAATRV